MFFKDIKQDYPVYILDKQQLTISQGKVLSIGFPRADLLQRPSTNPAPIVVDVTIQNGDKSATYTIPENLSITYAGDIVLSTDKEGLVHEIEALKNRAEQVLQSIDKQKEILEKANVLLADLNPVYKEKKETDLRFSKIETSISEMKDLFTKFINTYHHGDNNNTSAQ